MRPFRAQYCCPPGWPGRRCPGCSAACRHAHVCCVTHPRCSFVLLGAVLISIAASQYRTLPMETIDMIGLLFDVISSFVQPLVLVRVLAPCLYPLTAAHCLCTLACTPARVHPSVLQTHIFLNVAIVKHRVVLQQKQIGVLESAAAARREFLRYLCHELRTPGNTIVLGLDDLTAEVPPSATSVRDTIAMMQSAADGMQHILDSVLAMEKLEA
ncbi:MAG: hypothetical protein EOO65_04910, partial [Methanosarcinales archaeon]